MAFVVLNTEKLSHNFTYLNKMFKKHNIEWAVVSKILCGHKGYITEVINLGIKQICDSRVSNLKVIKDIDPKIETIYIKPPAKRSLKSIIKYADISINTEFSTIKQLNVEAKKLNKTHKIIIMIEMGELREGVMGDDFIDFYESVFNLSNIEVVGIGTNLNCLYGVLPNQDKLIQLSLYEQLIEAKFNKNITYVSGGSSVTIPLIFKGLLPKSINHFRVGETLFLGTDVYNDSTIRNMEHNVFQLFAEIIELSEKPIVPSGEMGTNVEGAEYEFNDSDLGKNSYRAILDIGLLDVEDRHIQPKDNSIEIAGSSSDMIVLDIGKNSKNYKVGDLIEFQLDYMGTLSVLNSKYIEKKIK
ncbi:MAG: alanine/ornithine racemase family PLP-dependent enzyme [Bacteroidales bacterium]|nr:alanine/ornithine racemase family PLP-dependent enzyme [Bacteroidales bacterium]